MSRVVEHLAELTAFRDRDLLDGSLAGALRDLLQPLAVSVYRVVGEAEQARWLLRARLEAGFAIAQADPLWSELESLPLLEAAAERRECLLRSEVRTLAGSGGSVTTLLPLPGDAVAAGGPGGPGVLEIETATALDAEALRLVSSILRVYGNFRSLLDYSERDTLTGLLNRKTFDETFLRLASAEPAPGLDTTAGVPERRGAGAVFGLGVIDIDHFKRVNDSWGHLIGDEVLLLVSRLMRSSFRFHDRLYRFGGEEFVVLVRCRNGSDAAVAMERLRTTIERHQFPQVGRITVSIGFTALRAGDTASDAFNRADRAVYWAKENGRNRVGDHEELVAQGHLADDSRRDSDVELF